MLLDSWGSQGDAATEHECADQKEDDEDSEYGLYSVRTTTLAFLFLATRKTRGKFSRTAGLGLGLERCPVACSKKSRGVLFRCFGREVCVCVVW